MNLQELPVHHTYAYLRRMNLREGMQTFHSLRECRLDSLCTGHGPVEGSCEQSELLAPIKDGKIFDQLSEY